ncbi:SDR family oxidoreductase [Curtobacterium sp. MCPF17_031]|uniref:SDR family NAD(P)-dependent oxidoreductase n=1 Tax=Curtobacterium sp. MCPF17_031 TaxID=2175653 RepID=UPI0015E892B3|nr:SDR family NAD(P)-dependent oxidoreductase [Curtobacterium sp. MCPF17_031]
MGLITGASKGIGAATAQAFARNGYEVVLVGRDEQALTAVALAIRETDGVAHVLRSDLADPTSVETVVRSALKLTGGRLNVLVNCAGIVGAVSVRTDHASVRQLIQVNLLAPIALMRSAIPHLVGQGEGAIVNVGSLAGELGVRGIYSASKFGLRGLSYSARRELHGTGVRVCLVQPGPIDEVAGSTRTPEAVASAILKSISGRARRRVFVTRGDKALSMLEYFLPVVVDRANRAIWRRTHAGVWPAADEL